MNIHIGSTPLSPADLDAIDWRAVPAGLREIKDAIGVWGTVSLTAQHGGRPLYVPRSITPTHPLGELLGPESAQKLARRFGGDRIDVPMPDSLLRLVRAERIRAARAQGETTRALAKTHNLSRRRILEIIAKTQGDNPPCHM